MSVPFSNKKNTEIKKKQEKGKNKGKMRKLICYLLVLPFIRQYKW